MTTEKTLHQLSIDHLNEAIKDLGETTRLMNIAETTGDKNTLLRLGMKKISLLESIDYHRSKIEIGE